MSIRSRGFLSSSPQSSTCTFLGVRSRSSEWKDSSRDWQNARGRERSESDDIPKLRRIPWRRCAICEISRRLVRRVRLCTPCIPSFIHLLRLSPAAPYLPLSILLVRSPVLSLARSRCLPFSLILRRDSTMLLLVP